MERKIILHIPHSSTTIPLTDGYVINNEAMTKEMLKLTDWYTDDLFDSDENVMIKTIGKTINSKVGAGWVILDVLGGLIPIVVDAATGSWKKLDQDAVDAQLEKEN